MARSLALLSLAVAARAATTSSNLYSFFQFDPLEHLAGVAPYFEPRDPPTDPAPPRGCTPARAAYLVRHAAIFANDFDYETFIEPFVDKVENKTGNVNWATIPGLNFLADWSAPISDTELELLTRVGKLEASQLGTSLSFRYPNLELPPRIWSSSAERTVESAKALIRGLELKDNQIDLVQIYEGKQAGADTLTPYSSCPGFSASAGSDQSMQYLENVAKPIVDRFNNLAPSFGFTAKDVYGMMQLCGYESVIRGSSPFCDPDLLSSDEWLGLEYVADLQYHYNVGYGSPVSGAVGLPWLNATASLLMSANDSNSNVQDLYVSFTHREMPPMVIVAMGLFNNSDASGGGNADNINATMPTDRANTRRAWRSSHMLPFLGNLAIERLACVGSPGFSDGEYYRVLVNNAPQPLPGCDDGPATSCSRDGFTTYLQQRYATFPGGYSNTCGVQYDNSTDTLNFYAAAPAEQGNGTISGEGSIARGL